MGLCSLLDNGNIFFNIATQLHSEEQEGDGNDTSGLQSFFTRAEAVILHKEVSFGAML